MLGLQPHQGRRRVSGVNNIQSLGWCRFLCGNDGLRHLVSFSLAILVYSNHPEQIWHTDIQTSDPNHLARGLGADFLPGEAAGLALVDNVVVDPGSAVIGGGIPHNSQGSADNVLEGDGSRRAGCVQHFDGECDGLAAAVVLQGQDVFARFVPCATLDGGERSWFAVEGNLKGGRASVLHDTGLAHVDIVADDFQATIEDRFGPFNGDGGLGGVSDLIDKKIESGSTAGRSDSSTVFSHDAELVLIALSEVDDPVSELSDGPLGGDLQPPQALLLSPLQDVVFDLVTSIGPWPGPAHSDAVTGHVGGIWSARGIGHS
ncbi:hypothetical protein EYF80_020232 [Liparis tanakae]|uniref:Uncharacterized protein n=1 Tax=Liparis tanakae TaxID=230148 RepID=A0A4Z2HV63_9TELE|nr:hypothetical protein EYF80_020232 [Liparis tanakae]